MRTRTKFVVPSIIALLGLMLAPAIVRAETSSGTVYHVGREDLESLPPGGEPSRPPGSSPRPVPTPGGLARAHRDGRGHRTGPEAKAEEGSKPSSPHPDGAHPGGHHPGGDDHARKRRQTAPANASPGQGRENVRSFSAGPGAKSTTAADASSDSSASSKVIPILIAVAILSALSIGIASYRMRGVPRR